MNKKEKPLSLSRPLTLRSSGIIGLCLFAIYVLRVIPTTRNSATLGIQQTYILQFRWSFYMKIAFLSVFCFCTIFLAAALSGGSASTQQEKVFFGNLHSHTSFSDGSGIPKEAYLRARDIAKLDYLALTEHNHAEALGSDRIGIATNRALYKGPGSNSLIAVARFPSN